MVIPEDTNSLERILNHHCPASKHTSWHTSSICGSQVLDTLYCVPICHLLNSRKSNRKPSMPSYLRWATAVNLHALSSMEAQLTVASVVATSTLNKELDNFFCSSNTSTTINQSLDFFMLHWTGTKNISASATLSLNFLNKKSHINLLDG